MKRAREGAHESKPPLSEQQQAVVARCRAPAGGDGRVSLVLAAAAAGKTTTLRALMGMLRAAGHVGNADKTTTHVGVGTSVTLMSEPAKNYILYVCFNRAASEDVEQKLPADLTKTNIHVSTAHSAALRYSRLHGKVDLHGPGTPVGCRCTPTQPDRWAAARLSPPEIEKQIRRGFQRDIDVFVGGDKATERDKELCAFWIYKTFRRFLMTKGGVEKLARDNVDEEGIGRLTYFPVIKNMRRPPGPGKDGRRLQHAPVSPGTFYTDHALGLWHKVTHNPAEISPSDGLPGLGLLLEDDVYMKMFEIEKVRLSRFSAILLDESQDLTESQVEAFVVNQPHADVFIVGDAVQSLYSWRGAKPGQLRELKQRVSPRAVDDKLELTQSFRFGERIASIANHILFIKATHARQKEQWHEYRIRGVGPGGPGAVRQQRWLEQSSTHTVVARSNATLIEEAYTVLAAQPDAKICVLGENSCKKLEEICKEVLELLPAYKVSAPFKFKGRKYDGWVEFVQEVEDREMQVKAHLMLLHKHAPDPEKAGEEEGEEEDGRLEEIISTFRSSVLAKTYREDVSDVVLATACQAKGLEWDRVKVADDFLPLVNFEPDRQGVPQEAPGFQPAAAAEVDAVAPMQFDLGSDYNGCGRRLEPTTRQTLAQLTGPRSHPDSDELNSWYVAVTRARLELHLPPKFWELHDALWKGRLAQLPKWDEGRYTSAEKRGIESLLERMRGDPSIAAADAGSEPQPAAAAAAAAPNSPSGATQGMAGLGVAMHSPKNQAQGVQPTLLDSSSSSA
jgi:superfamily I DNA/RNA helicase